MYGDVIEITQVRAEYTSARLILENLEHRMRKQKMVRPVGYNSAEVDYTNRKGEWFTVKVRDYDIRYLDRVSDKDKRNHINLIHHARQGDLLAQRKLSEIKRNLYRKMRSRFLKTGDLIENQHVIPYTVTKEYSPFKIGDKGACLLRLSHKGFNTPDFNVLASSVYTLEEDERQQHLKESIQNLEKLSGRKIGDSRDPLLIAMRSSMPVYLPGFMPTYLNVGLTHSMMDGLPGRYGKKAAVRIRLNNRKTILEALAPDVFRQYENIIGPYLTPEESLEIAIQLENEISILNKALLNDPYAQIAFFLSSVYDYYDRHEDTLRNFMGKKTCFPSVIFQRMVCSVIDENSYAGLLYSRHPRSGESAYLQFARMIYGEELMTGRLPPEDKHIKNPAEIKENFPAVYHFWKRLDQLEGIFQSPVMVEFTAVHGTFTILQVNMAELSGVGMLVAVIDMYRSGKITAKRVRELIKPYHIRQIESDAIDPHSLQSLKPFCQGFSVLPRSAISGRIYFSSKRAKDALKKADNVILVQDRFIPTDVVCMQSVQGIASLTPAAIHIITCAQNMGIPSLLNLEDDGVTLDMQKCFLRNSNGHLIKEGEWVTLSSKQKTLYQGKAVFTAARLLRFMAGEPVDLKPDEVLKFRKLSTYYDTYHTIMDELSASEIFTLQELGQMILYGKLKNNREKARLFVNQCYDVNHDHLIDGLLMVTLGSHRVNETAFQSLTLNHQVAILKAFIDRCHRKGLSGYKAGSFIIGSFLQGILWPVVFWESFNPSEIAFLISEWVLYQKYLDVLDWVGEKRLNRAKKMILSDGLVDLILHEGLLTDLMTLKLSRVELAEVEKTISPQCDSQTADIIKILRKPYSTFFDFSASWSLNRLSEICKREHLQLPKPDDV